MKATFLVALALVFAAPGNAAAVSGNSSPGYIPPTIEAPPQFNGGNVTAPPPVAPITPSTSVPVIVPRRR